MTNIVKRIMTYKQRNYFSVLKGKGSGLIIGGDARADSPGHSAKYGSYTVMEMRIGKILMTELVQSNEVGGSYYMEKEGLARSLVILANKG